MRIWKLGAVWATACVLLASCDAGSPTALPTPAPIPTATDAPLPTPIDTATPIATPTALPTPTAVPKVLPAPLYFLSTGENDKAGEHIWRLEADGATLTQVTHEAAEIKDYAVSPQDGSLAFITGNTLVKTDAQGQGRTVLVQGPDLSQITDDSTIVKEVRNVQWSADGTTLFYGLNGINQIGVSGGTSTVVKPSDPLPQPGRPLTQPIQLYWPMSPSPDGARLLVQIGYYGSEGTIAILNLSDASMVAIEGDEVPPCCNATWSADGQSLFLGNASPGMFGTGLWRIDAQTGQATRLIGGAREDNIAQLVGYIHPATDGRLYYFYGEVGMPAISMVPMLQMVTASGDGFSQQVSLRNDTPSIAEALWSHEATPSGAVIVDGSQATQYPFAGPLRYFKIDGSPAITLTEKPARLLRWGK